MKYKYILAIDPSGNYREGHGTTGWVLIDHNCNLITRGCIESKQYRCAEEYWDRHVELIQLYSMQYNEDLIVVIEEYRLYGQRAKNQTNSLMETPRLIGVMQWTCWDLKQSYSMQLASSVKNRWSDDILIQEGFLNRRSNYLVHTQSNMSMKSEHVRDAFRHAVHYAITRNEEHKKPVYKNKGAYNNVRSNYKSGYGETSAQTRSYRDNPRYRNNPRIREQKIPRGWS